MVFMVEEFGLQSLLQNNPVKSWLKYSYEGYKMHFYEIIFFFGLKNRILCYLKDLILHVEKDIFEKNLAICLI